MNSLISVISPVYNGQTYIGECIESIANQTYHNYEMIIVNDGSTDNTEDIIKTYQKKYKWIRLITIENHGQGYARNLAIKEAKGEYIAFLDSDDYWDWETLAKTVERIQKDASDYVIFNFKCYNKMKNKYFENVKYDFFDIGLLHGDKVIELFKQNAHFAVMGLYRKKFLMDNEIRFGEGYVYEDTPFYVKSVVSAKKVSIINEVLYYYVQNTQSTTRQKNSNRQAVGLIRAMSEAFSILRHSKYTEKDYREIYGYFFRKFTVFKWRKTPSFYRKKFTKDFLEIYRKEKIPYLEGDSRLNFFVKHKLFHKNTFIFSSVDFVSMGLLKVKEKVIKKK